MTILFDMPHFEIFKLVYPETARQTETNLKSKARELTTLSSAKEYLEARTIQIEKSFANNIDTTNLDDKEDESYEIPDNWRKVMRSRAWKRLMGGNISDKEMELLLREAIKEDTQEEYEEKPRRYLPESCCTCEYKKFIEDNCKKV